MVTFFRHGPRSLSVHVYDTIVLFIKYIIYPCPRNAEWAWIVSSGYEWDAGRLKDLEYPTRSTMLLIHSSRKRDSTLLRPIELDLYAALALAPCRLHLAS